MKNIIQRALPLHTKYILTDKKYIPLENSCGTGCDNCGKLIANIATVRDENGKSYSIGFDCLETLLINNSLLSHGDIAEYEKAKKMIPKILRFAKSIKEKIAKSNIDITGIKMEKKTFLEPFFYFYWLRDNQTTSRDNDYVKLKEMDFDFLIITLKNIFPKLNFIIE